MSSSNQPVIGLDGVFDRRRLSRGHVICVVWNKSDHKLMGRDRQVAGNNERFSFRGSNRKGTCIKLQ